MRRTIPELEGFGNRLETLRKKKGLTQIELADAIGTTQRMISHYESKVKSPPLQFIIKIAQVLNVSLDMLLGLQPLKKNDIEPKIAKKIKIIQQLPLRDQNEIWSHVNSLVTKNKLKEKI
jgi:transcriptional regulator with XRE-family HTH domain